MNRIRLGKILLLAISLLATTPVFAAGGPDGFGYVWAANTDPGGPPLEWIDISTTGTLVTGLTDDNASTLITLPLPFRYYWTDLNQISIGSNGWIAFGAVSNIASCFPGIPASGGPADSYVAPLMSDLIFTGAGNTGSVRTFYDALNGLFIVSYFNVPYWQPAAPGFFGSNTFQAVFDYNDRSIRFNYQSISAPTLNAACNDLVTGIEGPQGLHGLQVLVDTTPPAPATVRFTYPAVPLISVIDPAPRELLNPTSAATIVDAGTAVTLNAVVENSGTNATTSTTNARAQVFNSGGTSVYDQTVPFTTLNANDPQPVVFVPDYVAQVGRQQFRIDVSGGGDINAGNNQVNAELYGLTPNADNTIVYTPATVSNGSINWNGGTGTFSYGTAIFIDLPSDQYAVTAAGAFITNSIAGDTYALEIRDNDGPGGLPGTPLALMEVAAGAIVNNAWNTSVPAAPVPVDHDGFYLVWYQRSSTIFLGTFTETSLSRRGYELLDGNFATYRENDVEELMLRVSIGFNPRVDDVFKDGFE